MARPVTLHEPDGRFFVLDLPDEPAAALIQAAAGVVAAAPASDGRVRVLELLTAGGLAAVQTATWVLEQALRRARPRG